MIVGLGIDLVSVTQFAEQLADPASRFEEATFTEEEISYARRAPSHEPARHLAARYAAKEAAIKALDVACGRLGIDPPRVELREIEVARDDAGRPRLVLHGTADALAVEVGADRAWISLTHDGDSAAAVVTLERLIGAELYEAADALPGREGSAAATRVDPDLGAGPGNGGAS